MLSDRILVRSTLTRWPLFLLGGFGVLALIGAGLLAVEVPDVWPGLIVGTIGVTAILAAVFLEIRRVQRLMWLTLDDQSFTVTDNVGERTFRDDDVVSMALLYQENFENGLLKSVTRTFRVWIVTLADQPELVEMTNKIKVGFSDPLTVFIDRITGMLKARANLERQRGQSVLGEGWEIQGKNLLLRLPKQPEPLEVPLEEIFAADYIENQLKVWRRGLDEAVAELPLWSANCHLLKVLLDEEISRRPTTDGPPSDGGLGRILFARNSRQAGILLAVVGGILILASAGLGFFYLSHANAKDPADVRQAPGFLFASVLFLCTALIFLFLSWYFFRYLFRCHAFGVYVRTLFGERSLRYADVDTFTFSTKRQFHKGVYTGTYLNMTFVPFKETKQSKLVYSTQVKNLGSSLDDMRDHIAGILAGRIFRAVQSGETVTWTPNFTLLPEGLYYKPAGFFGRKAPELLAYDLVSGHNTNDGKFQLYQLGKPKPVVTESTSARNFYPGYFAFLTLLENPPAVPATTAAAAQGPFPAQH
jgi:hypothetical protein